MKPNHKAKAFNRFTAGGFVIALGIVYGDIGTSPLYTMQSLVENQGGMESVTESFIIGSISLIFWTLTLITTIKYVVVALRADNHQEGGIFSLYTLVRRMSKWLIIPAMIGGATLLSDGALTPAVTVTSAVEGLKLVPGLNELYSNQLSVVITALLILAALFSIQRFGTGFIGRLFGPVMILWFGFLGISGVINSLVYPAVFRAINPIYAIQFLASPENHRGLLILGSIFLATTGAEALYSDLGHVGRGNIYVSWPFVKLCIILSYFGQGAWAVTHRDVRVEHINPFFASVPEPFTVAVVILATCAAIIASQALISGSFTLAAEAMRLKIFPLFRLTYPGANLGQIYIPVINWLLFIVTSFTVIYFQSSANMEAAYGLAITITMLMTTILLRYFLVKTRIHWVIADIFMILFIAIEFVFFVASAAKIMHGGYIILIAIFIVFVMFVWRMSSRIIGKHVKSLNLKDYKEQLGKLRNDSRFEVYQTNVAYLTNRMTDKTIDRSILYSILDKHPKRACVYWFINVKVTDEPYTAEYRVDMMNTDYIVKLELFLGFRMPQKVPRYLKTIVQDLMDSGRLPKQKQDYSIKPGAEVGDFRYVIIEERVSDTPHLNVFERFIVQTKASIKHLTASPVRWFGLQYSEVTMEYAPLFLSEVASLPVKEKPKRQKKKYNDTGDLGNVRLLGVRLNRRASRSARSASENAPITQSIRQQKKPATEQEKSIS